MQIDEELNYGPDSRARQTDATSSSQHVHSLSRSQGGVSGTHTVSCSRRTGDEPCQQPSNPPPTYRTQGPNAPQGTKRQIDEVEEEEKPQETSIVKAPRLNSSRITQEPSVVKQGLPSIREHSHNERNSSRMQEPMVLKHAPSMHQPSIHHSSPRIQQDLSRFGPMISKRQDQPLHPPSRRNQEPSTVKRPIPSQHQPLYQHSSRTQESSIIKQPFPSKREPSHHPSSRRTQDPPILKQPLPSQARQPGSIRKEPLSSFRKYPLHFRSKAPSTAKSILTTPEDFKMASRQTRIESLRPGDRKTQEEWAQSMIKRASVCPENYAWKRRPGGYQCEGGGHGMTDELLAEGKGGIMAHRTKKWEEREGPYYQDPKNPGKFIRCDSEISFSSDAPAP